ncbi:related to SAC2 protein [Cephalotrichum gorgonifer]|uniref:Related to SAC2 protein n=1 Tax=Cephalotrichum gorgonifer TaxID=2041049 RepID=A0AAE8N636_9PEZI|nr:related to SAC2 protein [Cephalotrichum gorgonifer]
MWLDRLASQSGPPTPPSQPASRSYSPLPRRTSGGLNPYVTSQRASQTPRGSSVSLVSSGSATSLLGTSRRPNGSALRYSRSYPEGPAPEEVLEKLLGVEIAEAGPDGRAPHSITEVDLELNFDLAGLSLGELVATEPSGPKPAGPRRPQTVRDFEEQSSALEVLHKSIVECDDVLNSVETNFASFRNDLAVVSTDIETLQNRSTSLNSRLENRKTVRKALGPVIEELSVSPEIVSKVVEGPMDESWIKALGEVDKRATAYHKAAGGSKKSKAWSDLGPLLENLVLKAIERIRDYLVAQIKAIRSPQINAQVIQQQSFLRVKDAYAFLYKHHSALGDEICIAYMNTMRWYYHSQFTRYLKALEKIKVHVIDKNDLLGHEEAARKTSILSGSKTQGPPHDAFNLGRRVDHLKTSNQAALSSYLAEEDKSTHFLEVPFRNFNLALIDNASAEYTFLSTFFYPAMSLSTVSKHFHYIFDQTFLLGQGLTKSLINDTYDGLGLLLCIRLNQRVAFELQRRKIPVADGYINGTNMLLWPRLQLVMNHHGESVRQLAGSIPARPPARSASELAKLTPAPHVVTQKFGQLLHGILVLCTEAGDDEPVIQSLQRLRSEVEAFLTKQSKMFGDKRKQERFLYNNYSLILTIISDMEGKMAEEQLEHFDGLKAAFQEVA